MPPTAFVFVVCQALANQGPLDVNGFPVDGVKLNDRTCRNEYVQMHNVGDQVRGHAADFSNPNVCSIMAMRETPRWQDAHPGWYVKLVKCPRPDGTFPGDLDV